MRILFLTYSVDITGADLSMLALAEGLGLPCLIASLSSGPFLELARSRGLEIEHVSTGGSLLAMRSKTPLVRRIFSLHQLPALVFRIAKLAHSYDVVYVNAKKAVVIGGLAARIAGRHMVWHQRDIVAARSETNLRNRLSERILVAALNAFASRVFSVSRAAADTLIASGAKPWLVRIILNGVDPAEYGQAIRIDNIRSELGVPAGMPLIGCFGQLLPWKGQEVLLEAMKSLPTAHALIVGGAVQDNPGYAQGLMQRAQTPELAGRVHFLGRRSDVGALMRSVDIVVHPSTAFDPCPRVVIETLHAGTPVVATAVGGVPEIVRDGSNGLLIPPGDAQALACALRQLIDDPSLARMLADQGKTDALARLTIARVVDDVGQALGELASSK
jgi:glycosyltransferase involved in cell wall biosynthesis